MHIYLLKQILFFFYTVVYLFYVWREINEVVLAGDDDDSHPSNWWMSFFSSGELIKKKYKGKGRSINNIFRVCTSIVMLNIKMLNYLTGAMERCNIFVVVGKFNLGLTGWWHIGRGLGCVVQEVRRIGRPEAHPVPGSAVETSTSMITLMCSIFKNNGNLFECFQDQKYLSVKIKYLSLMKGLLLFLVI